MKCYIALVACLLGFVGVDGRMLGAPAIACGSVTDIVPSHQGTTRSTDTFPYYVNLSQFTNYTYTPEVNYTITLQGGSTNVDFKGFMIQGRMAADTSTRTGTFFTSPNNTYYQTQCDMDTAATHTNNTEKTYVSLYWTAPAAGTGPICFRFAMVDQFTTYWADLWSYTICEGQCTGNVTTPQPCPVVMPTTTSAMPSPSGSSAPSATNSPTPTVGGGGGAAGLLASSALMLFMAMLAIN